MAKRGIEMKPIFSDFDKLCQKLEAERNDLSYLEPKKDNRPEPIVTVIKERVYRSKSDIEQYGQRMFAAGRYSAGARDKVAVAANAWLEKQLEL